MCQRLTIRRISVNVFQDLTGLARKFTFHVLRFSRCMRQADLRAPAVTYDAVTCDAPSRLHVSRIRYQVLGSGYCKLGANP